MAQDRATREEAIRVKVCVLEMFEAIPKSKRLDFIGHLNDTFLFLEACAKALPSEKDGKKK